MPASMKYYCASQEPATIFAAAELTRYAMAVSGIALTPCANPENAQFILGTFATLRQYGINDHDDKWRDAVMIKSRRGKLLLSGPNPRCVLFAVYDYLERLGCRWLGPGADNELLPENMVLKTAGFNVFEKADYPYRGIAGFPSMNEKGIEYAKMLVDWMPKRKYNLYFLEGYPEDRPGDKWSIVNGEHPFQHTEHNMKDKSWAERQEISRLRESIVDEARKRGLLIERYGHGWNYGLQEHYAHRKGISRDQAHEELRAKGRVNKAADVAGTWFQLCMSRPEVKELYVEHIVDYLSRHKDEIDIAAIWLGDGYDNSCQCAECLKKPFSDWYLDILGDVARQMLTIAPGLKLEGLIYFETLEPPTRRFLDGLDNVAFIMAPWNRCYVHALDAARCCYPDWKPDYRNNRSHDKERHFHPLNADYFEAYQGWRKNIAVPCYFFEYYVLSEIGIDRHFLAYDCRNLARDIKDFKELGFEGCVSCQYALPDSPVNLVSETAGLMLWNRDADAEKIRKKLLSGLFGKLSGKVLRHLNDMYETAMLFDPHKNPYYTENPDIIRDAAARMEKREQLFDKDFPTENLGKTVLKRILVLKLDLLRQTRFFREALCFRDGGSKDDAIAAIRKIIAFLKQNEHNLPEYRQGGIEGLEKAILKLQERP